ncbi:MAG TPA: aldehyde dehydrogenase family protein [Anaeromyxobacteraceae bacterium]|nr:aldehyde dehydrogenase family protein [Anaeromyxobacteraceae bacterium]
MHRPRTLGIDDPYTGEVACEVALASPPEVSAAVTHAAEAQRACARLTIRERVALALAFADALSTRAEDAAREVTRATGKPLRESRREVEGAARLARGLAALAEEALAERPLPRRAGLDRLVVPEPVGVVLLVVPWSEPLLAAVDLLVPAVLAGNAVLLDLAARTALAGQRLAEAFAAAGAPAGLVQSVVVDRTAVAEILARPEVGLLAFEGLAEAGHEIHRDAARRFLPALFRLAGKDAAYVAHDADLDRAAECIASSAFRNAGQSRSCVQRVYVHGSVEQALLERLAAAAATYVPDDPMDDATTLGPLAEPELPAHAARQVADARWRGATLVRGGRPATVDGRGRFFQPTIVAGANHRMSVMAERVLAPLLAVMRVSGDEEAVRLVNDSRHGLTASVWTASDERALELGRMLEVGTVLQNHCEPADPEMPAAGLKESGLAGAFSASGVAALARPKSLLLRRSR